MEHKKAQIAIEFIVVIGAVFFFTTIFFLAVQENMRDKLDEREGILVKEIALIVQDEINLALKSGDGYTRDFEIPEKAGNLEYEITLVDGVVYLKTTDDKHALALPIANVTGEINITSNTIKKINGQIYLNE